MPHPRSCESADLQAMRARVESLYANQPVYLNHNRKDHLELIKKQEKAEREAAEAAKAVEMQAKQADEVVEKKK